MADFNPSRHVGNRDYTRSTVVIIGAGLSGMHQLLLRVTDATNAG
jgi:hypothetical protein